MQEHNEQPFDRDSLTASNRALYDACELLESRADVGVGTRIRILRRAA